jgi:uncharacterized lipoprotein YddW (UPF0748 family)
MDRASRLRAATLNVLVDIVKRYDVDAVHTDDYYYPYKVEDEKTKEESRLPRRRAVGDLSKVRRETFPRRLAARETSISSLKRFTPKCTRLSRG